jgi:hypothetical protein
MRGDLRIGMKNHYWIGEMFVSVNFAYDIMKYQACTLAYAVSATAFHMSYDVNE